jgi:hypothetical protein
MEGAARDYRDQGYAALPGLLAPDLAGALAAQFLRDLAEKRVRPRFAEGKRLLKANVLNIHSARYPLMQSFHWGLTPAITAIAGCDLVPSYALFRVYPQGAVCMVHGDRPACEHSISLTLASGGAEPWPLDIATETTPLGAAGARDDFRGEVHTSVPLAPGDAVIYRGITQRHGRLAPNPNPWSAHLFLHWVDRAGPHAAEAFDGKPPPAMGSAPL